MVCQRNRLLLGRGLAGLSLFVSSIIQGADARLRVVDAKSHVPLSAAQILSLSGQPLAGERGPEGEQVLPVPMIQNGFVARGQGYTSIAFVPRPGVCIIGKSLTIPLPPLGVFHGRVLDAETFLPVQGACIRLRDPRGLAVSEGQTDAKGDFSIGVKGVGIVVRDEGQTLQMLVTNAILILEILAPGYTPLQSPGVHEMKFDDMDRKRQIILVEGEERHSGKVVDPGGKALAGARIAWASQIIRGVASSVTEVGVATSGEDGLFDWTVPRAACRTLLIASQSGLGLGWAYLGRRARRGEEPSLVKLAAEGTLRVSAMDESGGALSRVAVVLSPLDVPPHWQMLSGAILPALYRDRPPWVGVTGDDGKLLLEGLPTGRFAIRLHGGIHVFPSAVEKEIQIGSNASWEGKLVPGRCVTVKVVTEDGNVVPGARVRFLAEQKSQWFGVLGPDTKRVAFVPVRTSFTSDAPGMFTGKGLPLGCRLKVQVAAASHKLLEQDIGKDEVEVTCILQKDSEKPPKKQEGATLTLLLSWNGACIHRHFFCVMLYPVGTTGSAVKRLVEVRNGVVVIDDLPSGVFDVVVAPSGFEPHVIKAVTIPATASVEMEMVPRAPIRAVIETSAPVTQVNVLDEEGRLMRRCALEEEGEFVLWGLVPGRYRVTAQGLEREEFVSVAPVSFCPTKQAVVKLVRAASPDSQVENRLEYTPPPSGAIPAQ
jgi:hypothetical protein